MSWGAVIGAGAGIIGGALASRGAGNAADAQAGASQAAIDEQRRVTNMLLRMQDPSRQFGYQAMGDLASLYGYSMPGYQNANMLLNGQWAGAPGGGQGGQFTLPRNAGAMGGRWGNLQGQIGDAQRPGGGAGQQRPDHLGPSAAGQPGNMSRFFTSPDYGFRRDEGTRGIEQSAAARGGAFSGNALRGLDEFNSNLAAGEYGNYFNRLMAMSGMGQTATTQAGNYMQQGAGNIGNMLQNQGDARASGIMGQTNAWLGGAGLGLDTMNAWNNRGGGGQVSSSPWSYGARG